MEDNTDEGGSTPVPSRAATWHKWGAGAVFVGVLLFWAYFTAMARFDPQLWYLNWPPGAYSLTAFSTSFRGPLISVILIMGFGVGIAKSSVIPAIAAGACAALLIVSGNDGLVRMTALKTGAAQVTCVVPQSRACQLNAFNRRYDLQESTPLSEEDSARYAQYSMLREQARLGRPPAGKVLPLEMARHQGELRIWEQRFKPELDALLGHGVRNES